MTIALMKTTSFKGLENWLEFWSENGPVDISTTKNHLFFPSQNKISIMTN